MCPVFIAEINFGNSSKKHANLDINPFFSYPILLDFFISLAKYFVRDCVSKEMFGLKLMPNHDKNIKQVSCLKVLYLVVLCKHCFGYLIYIKILLN